MMSNKSFTDYIVQIIKAKNKKCCIYIFNMVQKSHNYRNWSDHFVKIFLK